MLFRSIRTHHMTSHHIVTLSHIASRILTFHPLRARRALLPQQGCPFRIVFGAWRKCLLRQALGARQAGAGGGPCHRQNEKLILVEFAAQKTYSLALRFVKLHAVKRRMLSLRFNLSNPCGFPCRSKAARFISFLEPGGGVCCGRRWAPGRQGQVGAPATSAMLHCFWQRCFRFRLMLKMFR